MKVTPKAMEAKMISSQGVDIEVHTHAAKTGVMDILALLCSGPVYACAVTRIEASMRSINVMQMPGYGKSAFKTEIGAVTLDDHMAAIDLAVPSEGTVLYGYSHGGFFTTQYALKHGDKVRALVLVEPALYSTKEDLLNRAALIDAGKDVDSMATMLKAVESSDSRSEAQFRQVAEKLVANVNSGSTVAQEYRIRADNAVSEEDLAKLDIPVLLIAGTESQASFMVKRAFQSIPHASVCWIKGATHLSLEKIEYADQIARAVDAFLENIGANVSSGFKNLMAELNNSGVALDMAEQNGVSEQAS